MDALTRRVDDKPALSASVSSHNEWDTLEEVIVGNPAGALVPSDLSVLKATVPSQHWPMLNELFPGLRGRYPEELVAAAQEARGEFVAILRGEGVTVLETPAFSFEAETATPFWRTASGFCAANPRDSLLLIGSTLIEAPMCDRSRYFETFAYRPILRQLSRRGATWIAAPKPMLKDDVFRSPLARDEESRPTEWLVGEDEILFDGADFMRCGRDIFVTRSHVTNDAGIDWVEQVLGDGYRVHRITTRNPYAMHIDDTMMPLRPGLLLVSPDYLDSSALPSIFRSWDVIEAPRPRYTEANVLGSLSGWLNVNLLSLDSSRVIVEREQTETVALLRDLGFDPITCSFESYYPFIGSFHCATLDVRRRGTLESYF